VGCVGQQVTLCDPAWQATSRSSEELSLYAHEELYRLTLTFLLPVIELRYMTYFVTSKMSQQTCNHLDNC